MAVYSEVSASLLKNHSGRIDAEYYRPETLYAENIIKNQNHTLFGHIVEDGYRVVYENTKILRGDKVTDSDCRFVQASNISSNGLEIEVENVGFVSENDWLRYPKGRIKKGELLIEVKGQAEKVTIVPNDYPSKSLISGSLFKATIGELVTPEYAFAFFNSKYGKILRDRTKTNTLIGFVSKPELYKIPIPLPSSAKIEEITILVSKAIEKNEFSKSLYKQAQEYTDKELGIDQLGMEKPINYETRLSDVVRSHRNDAEYFNPITSKIVSNITKLKHHKIRDCFNIASGFPWNSSKFSDDGIGEPVVRIRNIRPGMIKNNSLTTLNKKYVERLQVQKAKPNDIVVGMDGIKYFYSSIIKDDCYVNQRVAHLSQKPGSVVSSIYASFIINSRIGQNQLLRDMTVANTVGHITNRNILELVIPYPSKEFHDEITDLVAESFTAKDEAELLLKQAIKGIEDLIEGVI